MMMMMMIWIETKSLLITAPNNAKRCIDVRTKIDNM